MDGWPVWLASVSRWEKKRPVETGKWMQSVVYAAQNRLEEMLDGVGDDSRERCFRMNLTLCRHRAVSEQEAAHVRGLWKAFGLPPWHMAGGPVEVLWMKGVKDRPSTRPCENPVRQPIKGGGGLWLPIDCEQCESCLARIECHRGVEIVWL